MVTAMGTAEHDTPKRSWSEFRPVASTAIVLLHAAGIAPVIWHLFYWYWPTQRVVVTAIVLYAFTSMGITAGYHRLFTHDGYKCGAVLKGILLLAAGMSLQGRALRWIRVHLEHHKYTDRPGDPHSPYEYLGLKGLLWAHVGWMFYRYEPRRGPRRIEGDPLIQLQARWYWVLAMATFGIPFAVGGWDGLFVAGFLRVILYLNATWCINSVCHLWGRRLTVKVFIEQQGRRQRQATVVPSDGSRNNRLLALPSGGEAYHALHHLFSRVAFHGWDKWDLDPTKWLLIVLERLGLVWDIQRPPRYEVVDDDGLDLPSDSFLRRTEATSGKVLVAE
jgi:stearoyl-CoA desaturase (Delta-9 desaturase)